MPTSKRPKAKLVSSADADVPDELLDAEIADDLAERQNLDQAGRTALAQRLREHGAATPKLSGGDVDADWDDVTGDGEETVGGETPTPNQDQVDDIGEGAGLTYQDDEPLNYAKVAARDQHRWELNAASASTGDEDELEEELELDDDDELEEDDEAEDLDELGLVDGEADALEVLDVDDLAEDEDEAEEVEESDLEDVDELEDDDSLIPDEDEDEDDEEDDLDDDDDEDDDF